MLRSINACLLSSLILSVLVAVTHAAEPPQKIALLVGIADYANHAIADLTYAENDVVTVGAELTRLGFQTNVLSGNQATRQNVAVALDQLLATASTMESDAIVFLMFSGHGQELKTVTTAGGGGSITIETPFFLPYDALPVDPNRSELRGKSAEELTKELNLVSLNHVIDSLDRGSNSRRNLLVVDACRNNPAKGKSAGISGNVAMNLPSGISILFAAGSGQKSWESTDQSVKHGVMTHYLLEGLRGQAMNQRSELTWSRLLSHVREGVEFDAGKLAGGRERIQTPHSIENIDSIVVLNDPLFAYLQNEDWLQDKRELRKATKLDPEVMYVVEYWPQLSGDVIKQFAEHRQALAVLDTSSRNVIVAINDNHNAVESLLNQTVDGKTFVEQLPDVAVVAYQDHRCSRPYIRDINATGEPYALFLGHDTTPLWRGTLEELNWPTDFGYSDLRESMLRAVNTIGSPPPPLVITDWFTDGDGRYRHESEFRDGNVYVIEIWATWCGPCINAMSKLVKLQRQYADQRVHVISVSDEESKAINTFLDRELDDKARENLNYEDNETTFREAYRHYSVVSDTTGLTWNRYMHGTGNAGFPHCVVVGRSGLVEWMGHTLELEEPLRAIVDGTWDHDAFREELRRTKLNEIRQTELRQLIENEGIDEAFAMVDGEIKNAFDDEAREEWTEIRFIVGYHVGRIDDDCLRYFLATIDRFEQENDSDSIIVFAAGRAFEFDTPNELTLSVRIIKALQFCVKVKPEEEQWKVYFALGKTRLQRNELSLSQAAFAKAKELVPAAGAKNLDNMIDEITQWRTELDKANPL